jgi:hypothetical protein
VVTEDGSGLNLDMRQRRVIQRLSRINVSLQYSEISLQRPEVSISSAPEKESCRWASSIPGAFNAVHQKKIDTWISRPRDVGVCFQRSSDCREQFQPLGFMPHGRNTMNAIAISNNDAVYLHWNFTSKIDDCLGFTVIRHDDNAGNARPLPAMVGSKGAKSAGNRFETTDEWPIQNIRGKTCSQSAVARIGMRSCQ